MTNLGPTMSRTTRKDNGQSTTRVVCGARRRRDGQLCEALGVPGKKRCKWHGGLSTGPKTPEGRARVTANLPGRPENRAEQEVLASPKEAERPTSLRTGRNRRVERSAVSLAVEFKT